jgi:hypothetical protein
MVRVFASQGEKTRGGSKKSNKLRSLRSIIRVIELKRTRWIGYVAHTEGYYNSLHRLFLLE